MTVTIDSAGRLVIPKALRDAAGIRPGEPLEARLRDGLIEIEPAPMVVDLVEKQGVLVAEPLEPTPHLTAEAVMAALDRLRSEH